MLMPAVPARRLVLPLVVLMVGLSACSGSLAQPSAAQVIEPWTGVIEQPAITPTPTPTEPPQPSLFPGPVGAGTTRPTPTPDAARSAPAFRTTSDVHYVGPGDTLNGIAYRYGVGVQQLMQANGLFDPNFLAVGQQLFVPASEPLPAGPSLKLLPDSELVYGPSASYFNTRQTVSGYGGALDGYREEVEGELLSGDEIVELVARRYSVHPKLLLAVLEYSAGWVTQPQVSPAQRQFPVGLLDMTREGMFSQVSWAADQLNAGFYLWRAGWAGPYLFPDGRVAPPGTGINAATAGVQYLYAQLHPYDAWQQVVGPQGFLAVYQHLFGDPFDWAVEPLVPDALVQPPLQLPFERGAVWSFTSGPHGAWGGGSAWAALDFAPPGFALGCVWSDAWITAVADGEVVRTDLGVVIQDLEGDGFEGLGWSIVYLHVDGRERVEQGVRLAAGDRIGHPSCEGGVSNGTHLHLARKYNGVWIEADGGLPFEMDGWQSAGTGVEYDGTLISGQGVLEACSCRDEGNQISR